MRKSLISFFLMLVLTVPSLARSKDVYPVSCDDLWDAVKDSLNNPRDYGILSLNDVQQKASFFVIGGLASYTDRIELSARDGGCAMKSTFLQVGPDNSDWRVFHHQLERSLAKLQAAKSKPAEIPAGHL